MEHTHFAPHIPPGQVPTVDGAVTTCLVPREVGAATVRGALMDQSLSLTTIAARDVRREHGVFHLSYVFSHAASHTFLSLTLATRDTFPSFAAEFPRCAFYEREVATMFGLIPEGHPDSRPTMARVSFSSDTFPLRKDFTPSSRTAHDPLSAYSCAVVDGEGVYEIPVGPVHAGIIEPGHFRFSVLGEHIQKLDALLGWKHKGIEKLFETLPVERTIALAERVSGDSSFAHSLAYCMALETLSGTAVHEQVALGRVVFGELERLANHFSDIGFIMLDTAFSFGGAHGARLRERIMRWHERLSGNRFLRGVCGVGTVTHIPKALRSELIADSADIRRDFADVVAVAEQNLSLHERLATTGRLTPEVIAAYGVVGVPARAGGSTRDVRADVPYAAYGALDWSVVHRTTGDVHGRFFVRIGEVYQSLGLIEQALHRITDDTSHGTRGAVPPLGASRCAVALTEGWRGEVAYLVYTDVNGALDRVKVRDPSFLNWQAFPHAAPGEVVPDFPLINKSFNLSYTGNDL